MHKGGRAGNEPSTQRRASARCKCDPVGRGSMGDDVGGGGGAEIDVLTTHATSDEATKRVLDARNDGGGVLDVP